MQFLAQRFVVLVIGGMQNTQGMAVAVDSDAVEILHIEERLAVEMNAGITAFGNQNFDFTGIGYGGHAGIGRFGLYD